MTLPILILLSVVVIAVILFAFEWVAADVVALGVLITLIVTGLIPADQAFAGFGSSTVITISPPAYAMAVSVPSVSTAPKIK